MLQSGHILDNKYEIIKILGKGGMGTVYLCKNIRLGNLWAIKEFKSNLGSELDFLAEPNVLKNLNHPGIPRIIDIFYENNSLYMIEDYIEGETLKEYVIRKGSLSSKEVSEISIKLCEILSYLHGFNPPIIYRDLKPSNIMIRKDSQVMLIDFGIARTFKEGQNGDTMILGSNGYIAPEQLNNIQSNFQTDIYSLGAVMYFLLCGNNPEVPVHLLTLDKFPAKVDNFLKEIIRKAVSINPEDRYKHIDELSLALRSNKINVNYEKTTIMDKTKHYDDNIKASYEKSIKPKNKIKFAIIASLTFILIAVFVAFKLLDTFSKEPQNPIASKKVINSFNDSNTVKETETPKTQQPPNKTTEAAIEKDNLVKGIIYVDKAIVVKNEEVKGKGKGKNKKSGDIADLKQVSFNLTPAASLDNSKLSVSLTKLELIEDYTIIYLNIENKTNTALDIDLSKTYFLNAETQAKKTANSNFISVGQNSRKENLKFYFKDFDFKGSSYTFKTAVKGEKNKDIILSIEVK